MKDFGLLILRLTVGGLLAGHGAQKLFGWFGGYGIKGTTGWLESMGMKPGKPWALMAGASEFGGGVLTALGALNPVGPIATIGAMGMATAKVHWGKPIWVTAGGAELPVVNMAAALALGMAGPGNISVDKMLGIKLPRRLLLVPGLALAAGTIAAGVIASNRMQAQMEEAPQAQVEESPEAVRVPEITEAAHDMEQDTAWAAQEQERVAGAELQAGESADHPA